MIASLAERKPLNEQALQQYLYDHIPLSRAMQVEVLQAQPAEVILRAPLTPNINHMATVFGGSASAVAILAAWSLLHTRLAHAGLANRLVIQGNTMQYTLPIAGAFTARARIAETADWPRFVQTFQRRGRARITVTAVLKYEGRQAGELQGEFVALQPE